VSVVSKLVVLEVANKVVVDLDVLNAVVLLVSYVVVRVVSKLVVLEVANKVVVDLEVLNAVVLLVS